LQEEADGGKKNHSTIKMGEFLDEADADKEWGDVAITNLLSFKLFLLLLPNLSSPII
jgi:hypothetical protein